MDAHAVVLRSARAPVVARPTSLRSPQPARRQVPGPSESQYIRRARPYAYARPSRDPAHPEISGRSAAAPQLAVRLGTAGIAAWKSGTALLARIPLGRKMAARIAVGACAAAIIALAVANNLPRKTDEPGFAPAINETVIYRQASVQSSFVEDEEEAAADAEDSVPLQYPRTVHTIKFVNPDSASLAAAGGTVMAKVGGFVAFPGRQTAEQQSASGNTDWLAARRSKGAPNMDEVDQYLWEVYQREPIKKDGSGDFTWKDPAAAQHAGMSLPEYVIDGMDPEFREQLYHAGKAMDAAGIRWSMLSAFRDDYRQNLAKGFKARVGRSLHGGSQATGGYGHGRAVDLTNADGDADIVWRWIDAHGAKFGLHRPIPGPDPAHVQSRGDWRKLALGLRESRLRTAAATAAAGPTQAPKGNVLAKAGL